MPSRHAAGSLGAMRLGPSGMAWGSDGGMERIYLDNAATSWPKPPAVYDAVDRFLRTLGAPAGRGTYHEAAVVERLVASTRWRIAQLLGAAQPERVIFSLNGTDALNLALHGMLRPGDHIVTTVVEHNSVLRPLRHRELAGDVEVAYVPCDGEGVVDVEAIRRAIRPRTRCIALSHASNVTGALQPAKEVGQLARQHGICFLLDAAQSLGHVPVDVVELQIDLLAASGHKGLLGPLGTGVLYVAPSVERELRPVRQGGTGTHSELDEQPEELPERLEAGNLNVPGVVGLGAGVEFVLREGVTALRQAEMRLVEVLWQGLGEIPGITRYGPGAAERRCGVVSFTVAGYDPQEVASLLDASCRLQVRSGLHCAPRMHASLGTLAGGGTVRVSLGPFVTGEQVEVLLRAVSEMAGAPSP